MIHNIYDDKGEEGEGVQKVWLASGGSFGGLLRFVPSLPPLADLLRHNFATCTIKVEPTRRRESGGGPTRDAATLW